ncbi:exported hypothetical protein [Cupriavidus taiwanensis]|uniref:Uncharacterized protein n=1 Tax=Cupriavidus taiwanensis TaxID=164546 RepID=A0A975XFR4_9BURK|nr:exported hypothetical protein [Cupriavidus taiwanensis]
MRQVTVLSALYGIFWALGAAVDARQPPAGAKRPGGGVEKTGSNQGGPRADRRGRVTAVQ